MCWASLPTESLPGEDRQADTWPLRRRQWKVSTKIARLSISVVGRTRWYSSIPYSTTAPVASVMIESRSTGGAFHQCTISTSIRPRRLSSWVRMDDLGCRCDLHLYSGQGHGFFNFANEKYFTATITEADRFLASLGYLEGQPELPDNPGAGERQKDAL